MSAMYEEYHIFVDNMPFMNMHELQERILALDPTADIDIDTMALRRKLKYLKLKFYILYELGWRMRTLRRKDFENPEAAPLGVGIGPILLKNENFLLPSVKHFNHVDSDILEEVLKQIEVLTAENLKYKRQADCEDNIKNSKRKDSYSRSRNDNKSRRCNKNEKCNKSQSYSRSPSHSRSRSRSRSRSPNKNRTRCNKKIK